MSEPTRDEINRALAEWEGWTDVRTRVCPADCCRDTFGIPPGSKLYSEVEMVPDYAASLDAQMPLWERLEDMGRIIKVGMIPARFHDDANRAWATVECDDGHTDEWHANGVEPAEAAARALYAVLEATK